MPGLGSPLGQFFGAPLPKPVKRDGGAVFPTSLFAPNFKNFSSGPYVTTPQGTPGQDDALLQAILQALGSAFGG